MTPRNEVSNQVSRGVKSATYEVSTVTPEPSIEPSLDPSIQNPQKKSRETEGFEKVETDNREVINVLAGIEVFNHPSASGHSNVVIRNSSAELRSGLGFMNHDAAIQSHLGTRSKAASIILNTARSKSGKALTGTERTKLRKPVEEWLEVGHSPEAIVAAIGAATYRTANAIGGELEKESSGMIHSVGNDTLAAAAKWLQKQERR